MLALVPSTTAALQTRRNIRILEIPLEVPPTELPADGVNKKVVMYVMFGPDRLLAYETTRQGFPGIRFLVEDTFQTSSLNIAKRQTAKMRMLSGVSGMRNGKLSRAVLVERQVRASRASSHGSVYCKMKTRLVALFAIVLLVSCGGKVRLKAPAPIQHRALAPDLPQLRFSTCVRVRPIRAEDPCRKSCGHRAHS